MKASKVYTTYKLLIKLLKKKSIKHKYRKASKVIKDKKYRDELFKHTN